MYHSAIASHEEQRLNITLYGPEEDETYQLWYHVGAGGGHSIHLSYVKIQSLVFDDPLRSFGNAHNFLYIFGAFPAWDRDTLPMDEIKQVHAEIEQLIVAYQEQLDTLISFADRRNVSEAIFQQKLLPTGPINWPLKNTVRAFMKRRI